MDDTCSWAYGQHQAACPSAGPVPAFRSGGHFLLGAEEELLLVDAQGGLVEGAEDLLRRLGSRDVGGATPCAEVFTCQVEFGAPVVQDAESLVHSLGRARAAVVEEGQRPVAVGVHPASAFGDLRTVSSPRYDAITAQFAGLLRAPTSAYQVHVGVPDTAAMVSAFRGLRNRLAVLRALAAGSPYWHGRDSGFASARAVLLWSYPRVGVPPAFSSFDEYAARVQEQVAAAEVPDHTYLWWDLRPQPGLGTLEVRVMDAVASLDLAAGLAALVQGLARHAVEHPSGVDLPTSVLRENDFRAARYGIDARIVDVDGRMRALRDVAGDALDQARAVLGPEGRQEPLDFLAAVLSEPPESERQRRVVARGGVRRLLDDLVDRTGATAPSRTRRAEPAMP